MKDYKQMYLYKQTRLTKRIKTANRRARKAGAKGTFTRRTIESLYVKQRGKCACGCNNRLYGKFELDHIQPLSKGGSNEPENLQLLKPICNKNKGAKWID